MKHLLTKNGFAKWILLVIVISIPTFVRMLQPGIYSMQDFPYFRVVEYSRCFQIGEFPCRWAQDSGLGYGEPVFNFYSHVPFLLGALLTNVISSSVISLKIVFALSFVGSAIAMFFLSREVWKNNYSALVSSVLYLYAPYRAVNVWVRGALPESFAFIFFPLILYFFERYSKTKRIQWLAAFTISLSLLILTHNLSVLMFGLVLLVWCMFRAFLSKSVKTLVPVILSICLSLGLSAFYLLPTVLESQYVRLATTTVGYFDFRAHFITLNQIFISRFWGYGGSTWGDGDGLSLSFGQAQGIFLFITIAVSVYTFFKSKQKQQSATAFILSSLTVLFLLLTHNKTAFIWEAFSPVMKYIQFPWRFLGVSLFCLSLSSGYVISVLNKKFVTVVTLIVVTSTLLLNTQFFKEDLWFNQTDRELQSGELWVEQSRASIGDYWPTFGPIPTTVSERFTMNNQLVSGSIVPVTSAPQYIELPIAYFPGWSVFHDNDVVESQANKEGLISFTANSVGNYQIRFTNTPVREWGNAISVFSLMVLLCVFKYYSFKEKQIS